MCNSILLFIAIAAQLTLFAQSKSSELGYSKVISYTAKKYKSLPQNFAIAQGQKGFMYFGNNKGVLQFDGVYWRVITISNQSIVRSLSVSKKNEIYVGADDEIGLLISDSSGALKFESLNKVLLATDSTIFGFNATTRKYVKQNFSNLIDSSKRYYHRTYNQNNQKLWVVSVNQKDVLEIG
jgi:hypothetical protein